MIASMPLGSCPSPHLFWRDVIVVIPLLLSFYEVLYDIIIEVSCSIAH